MYTANLSQLSGIKKVPGGPGRVGQGAGEMPLCHSLSLFFQLQTQDTETRLSALNTQHKGTGLSTHQHVRRVTNSQAEKQRDYEEKFSYLRAGSVPTMTLTTSETQEEVSVLWARQFSLSSL